MKCAITKLDASTVKVVTPYSPIVVERLRAVPGARPHYLNGKFTHWTMPLFPDTLLMVCDVCGVVPEMLDAELRGLFPAPVAEKPLDVDAIVNGHHFETVPYEHQRRNLARLMVEDRWLLADEQGTGKSHSVSNRIKMLPAHQRILIVCPASVIPGWRDQLRLHAGVECTMVVGASKQRRCRILAEGIHDGCEIFVVGYEGLLAMQDEFFQHAWDVLVLDEVQRLKNLTAKASRVVQQLSRSASKVWGLSGTPAPNGLEDWLGVMEAIKPGHLPVETKSAFEARYTLKARIGENGPWKISGYRNVQELRNLIRSITSRVTKAEALDLPPKVISTRWCSMEGEQARVYRELRRDAVARLESLQGTGQLTAANVLSERLRLLQIVGGFVPDDTGVVHEIKDKCKLDALRDVIEEVGDKQVVVWCAFLAEAAFLRAWLEKEYGGGVSDLTGQTKDRDAQIQAFASGANRWFVGSAGAGGTGVNGLQVCSVEVYYSRNFRLDHWLQSQDRCHRIGSKESVSVIKLVCEGSVDERVDQRLDEKEGMMELVLGSNVEEML